MTAKVISTLARKGGSGKSTAAKLMASAIVDAGQTLTLIDTDPQGDLTRWWAKSIKFGNTSPNVKFYRAPADADALYEIIDKNDASSDCIIIDTKGEGADWSDALLGVCDIIVSPLMLAPVEVELSIELRDWFTEARQRFPADAPMPKHYYLLSRVGSKKATGITADLRATALAELDLLEVELRESKIILYQDAFGFIAPQWQRLREGKGLDKGQAQAFKDLLDLGYELMRGVLTGKLAEKEPTGRS